MFFIGFWNLNRRFKHKLYPMPKNKKFISSSMDLVMPCNQTLTWDTIILDSRKTRSIYVHVYSQGVSIITNNYLQGYATPWTFSMGKMKNIFQNFKYIRVYINGLLVLLTNNQTDHLSNLEQVFVKLQENRLKCIIERSFLVYQKCGNQVSWLPTKG